MPRDNRESSEGKNSAETVTVGDQQLGTLVAAEVTSKPLFLAAAVFFLLCWKSIRVLFMKMVDWEVAKADFVGAGGGGRGDKRRAEVGCEFKSFRVSSTPGCRFS